MVKRVFAFLHRLALNVAREKEVPKVSPYSLYSLFWDSKQNDLGMLCTFGLKFGNRRALGFLSPRYTKKRHSDHSHPSATQAWLPRGSYHHCQALRNGRWCSFDKYIDGQVFDGFSAFAIHSVTGFVSEQKVDGESSRKHHQQTVVFSGLMLWFFWSHHLHPSCQQFLSSNSSMQPGFS